MDTEAINQLNGTFRGDVLEPGDAEYDDVRALYNGMIDKRPRLIARCCDTADVVTVVCFGRDQGLLVALRGCGHNGPGLGSCNDGLLIDLSRMKGVYVDPIFWDLADARRIMAWYRDFLPTAPREMGMFLGLKRVPKVELFPEALWGRPIVALMTCYNGTEEEGIEAMRPVREALPEPLLDGMTQMPFPMWQSAFDPILPKGLQWYWKGDFVKELPDEAIDVHIEHASRIPDGLSLMHLYPINGAVHDTDSNAMAWSCRDANWSMVIAGIDPEPKNAEAITRWARDYWEAVHPYNASGAYINFMMEEGDERVQATYGPNYPRLARIKARYDPDNFFRVNQNIRPG